MMRDLGIVLGSLKRHGQEPLEAIPELTPLLLDLGKQADLVPRDTVQHYTSWNPADDRRRTYTGDQQEAWLQDAVRRVFPGLSASLAITETLVLLDPRDARFAPTAAQLTGTVQPMLETIDSVTAHGLASLLRPGAPSVLRRDQRRRSPLSRTSGRPSAALAGRSLPLGLRPQQRRVRVVPRRLVAVCPPRLEKVPGAPP